MRIECNRTIDASVQNAHGAYEYYYEYDVYRFTEGPVCFLAISHLDEPDQADFVGAEILGNRRSMCTDDLLNPLFIDAVERLRTEGKARIRWLNGGLGYEDV